MNIRVVLKYDKQVKSYSAYCPELPGCTSCGASEKETMRNIHEAVELYLEPSNKIHFPKSTKIKIFGDYPLDISIGWPYTLVHGGNTDEHSP